MAGRPGVPFSTTSSDCVHRSHAEALFDALDTNGDGVLSRAEFTAARTDPRGATDGSHPWASSVGVLPSLIPVHLGDTAAVSRENLERLSAEVRSKLSPSTVRHEAALALDATQKLLRDFSSRPRCPAARRCTPEDLSADLRAMAAVHKALEAHNKLPISAVKVVENEEWGWDGMKPEWRVQVDWSHRQREVVTRSRATVHLVETASQQWEAQVIRQHILDPPSAWLRDTTEQEPSLPKSAAALSVIAECLTCHNQLEHRPIDPGLLTVQNTEFVPAPGMLVKLEDHFCVTWIVTVSFHHHLDPAFELVAKIKLSKTSHIWGSAEVISQTVVAVPSFPDEDDQLWGTMRKAIETYNRYEDLGVPNVKAPWPRITTKELTSNQPEDRSVDWDAISWRVRGEWENPLCDGLMNNVELQVNKCVGGQWTAELVYQHSSLELECLDPGMIESADAALRLWNCFETNPALALPGLEPLTVAGAVVAALGVEMDKDGCWIEIPLSATWSFGQASLVTRRFQGGWITDVVHLEKWDLPAKVKHTFTQDAGARSAIKAALSTHNRFSEVGLDNVSDCSILDAELVYKMRDDTPTSLGWECLVDWVHPGCAFVLNEAILAIAWSETTGWVAAVKEQQSQVNDALAFQQIPHETRALGAIVKEVSHFNHLDGLEPSGVVVQKVWGSRAALSLEESGNGNHWVTMGVEIEAMCGRHTATAALMLVRSSHGWVATLVHLNLLEEEARPVMSRMVDTPNMSIPEMGRQWPTAGNLTRVSEAVATALELHNKHRELGLMEPVDALEVLSVQFIRCSAGDIPDAVVSSDNTSGSIELEVKVQWVHPGCAFVLHEAMTNVVRDAPTSPWTARVLEQRTIASEIEVFERISRDQGAMAAISGALSEFNQLGAVDPSTVKLTNASDLETRFGAEVLPEEAAEVVWVSVDVSVTWEQGPSAQGNATLRLHRRSSRWHSDILQLSIKGENATSGDDSVEGDFLPLAEAAKEAISRHNFFSERGLGRVSTCSLLEITTMPTPESSRVGEVNLEVRVGWLHPACRFVSNEATVSLSRASRTADWQGHVLSQHTLITKEAAQHAVSEDTDAMATLAETVSRALLLGEDVGPMKASLGSGEVQLCVELNAEETGQNSDGSPWFTMRVSVDWEAQRLKGSSLMELSKHGKWSASVCELCAIEAHTEFSVGLMYDKGVGECMKTALNQRNQYGELVSESGGVRVLSVDSAEAVVTPVSGFTRNLDLRQPESPQTAMWHCTARWAHPACRCFTLQKAVVVCRGTFLVGWDFAAQEWRAQVESQEADVESEESRKQVSRVLASIKDLQDLSVDLISQHNELGVPGLDELRVASISIPQVVLGDGVPLTPNPSDEPLVWITVDEVVWEAGSTSCTALGRFRFAMRFERAQKWEEGGWLPPTWQVHFLGITAPTVSKLFREDCVAFQNDSRVHKLMIDTFQKQNKLGALRVDEAEVLQAAPGLFENDRMQWDLFLEWKCTKEQGPVCEAVAHAYCREDIWVVDVLWQKIKIESLSDVTRKRMGCDGGTISKVGDEEAVFEALSQAVLRSVCLENEQLKEASVTQIAPIVYQQEIRWAVEFHWTLPVPPETANTTNLVLRKHEDLWEAEIVSQEQLDMEFSENERIQEANNRMSASHLQGFPTAQSGVELSSPCVDTRLDQSGHSSSGFNDSQLPGLSEADLVMPGPAHVGGRSLFPPLSQSDLLKGASVREGNPRHQRGVMAGPRDGLQSNHREPTELEFVLAKEWAEKLMQMPLSTRAPLPRNPQWK